MTALIDGKGWGKGDFSFLDDEEPNNRDTSKSSVSDC